MDVIRLNLIVEQNTLDCAHHWPWATDKKICFTVQCINFNALQIIPRNPTIVESFH